MAATCNPGVPLAVTGALASLHAPADAREIMTGIANSEWLGRWDSDDINRHAVSLDGQENGRRPCPVT